MKTNTLTCKYKEITFSDADVVNPDDFIPSCETGRSYNPHNVRPFLIHDHGFAVAVVFASCLQDALDEACDRDKLDRWQIHPEIKEEREDYMQMDFPEGTGQDENCPEYVDSSGNKWWWQPGHEPAYLGNAGEPFDLDTLNAIELPNPPFSFAALFNAMEM